MVEKKIEFANQLNKLFYRFEKGNVSNQRMSSYLLLIWLSTFKQLNQRKAIGPDNLINFEKICM